MQIRGKAIGSLVSGWYLEAFLHGKGQLAGWECHADAAANGEIIFASNPLQLCGDPLAVHVYAADITLVSYGRAAPLLVTGISAA